LSFKTKCCFSTNIANQISCSPNGQFDDYGFSILKCEKYPCERYKEMLSNLEHLEEFNKIADKFLPR
jgi:hypothetical protein